MFSSFLCCALFVSPNPEILPASKIVLEKVADVSGYYICKGSEAGGKPYNGMVLIAKKSEIYIVQWVMGGGSTFTGVGIRQGNSFAVSWAMTSDKGLIRGINTYRVEPGPRLVGRWATLPGPGVLQNETLTFLKNLDED